MASVSCNASFGSAARAFSGLDQGDLIKYMESVWESCYSDFPNLMDENCWNVEVVFKAKLGSHYSLLFTIPNCTQGFMVHLIKDDKKEVKFLIEVVDLRDEKWQGFHKRPLGPTRPITAHDIITKGHDRLVKMGNYHAVLNNCQDYCQKFAKDLGLDAVFTDFERVGVYAGAVGTGIAAATVATGVAAAVIGVIIKLR